MRRFCTWIQSCSGEWMPAITAERPREIEPCAEAAELAAHVIANQILNMELQAEYLNRGKQFKRIRGSSATAHKRFYTSERKTGTQFRNEYFDELKSAIEQIEARLPKPEPKEKTYEDVIKSWGGRFVGESEVMPRQKNNKTVLSGE